MRAWLVALVHRCGRDCGRFDQGRMPIAAEKRHHPPASEALGGVGSEAPGQRLCIRLAIGARSRRAMAVRQDTAGILHESGLGFGFSRLFEIPIRHGRGRDGGLRTARHIIGAAIHKLHHRCRHMLGGGAGRSSVGEVANAAAPPGRGAEAGLGLHPEDTGSSAAGVAMRPKPHRHSDQM